MTTSAPPAWHWLHECYVPAEVITHMTSETPGDHEYGQMREEALSIHSHKLPESDALRERNDSLDPTGEDIWPLERAVSTTASSPVCADQCANGEQGPPSAPITSDQCPECRCAPGQPHATGCDVSSSPDISCDRKDDATACESTARLADSVINAVPEHVDCCVPEGSREHPTAAFYMGAAIAGIDVGPVTVESCPECGTVTDIDYGESVPCGQVVGEDGICGYWSGGNHGPNSCTRCGFSPCECECDTAFPESGQLPKRESGTGEETFDVPFKVQEHMFESQAERSIAWLHGLIDDHHTRIVEMARDRFRKGYAKYGSAMYAWSPERRLDETLQELADSVVYPTSGPIE